MLNEMNSNSQPPLFSHLVLPPSPPIFFPNFPPYATVPLNLQAGISIYPPPSNPWEALSRQYGLARDIGIRAQAFRPESDGWRLEMWASNARMLSQMELILSTLNRLKDQISPSEPFNGASPSAIITTSSLLVSEVSPPSNTNLGADISTSPTPLPTPVSSPSSRSAPSIPAMILDAPLPMLVPNTTDPLPSCLSSFNKLGEIDKPIIESMVICAGNRRDSDPDLDGDPRFLDPDPARTELLRPDPAILRWKLRDRLYFQHRTNYGRRDLGSDRDNDGCHLQPSDQIFHGEISFDSLEFSREKDMHQVRFPPGLRQHQPRLQLHRPPINISSASALLIGVNHGALAGDLPPPPQLCDRCLFDEILQPTSPLSSKATFIIFAELRTEGWKASIGLEFDGGPHHLRPPEPPSVVSSQSFPICFLHNTDPLSSSTLHPTISQIQAKSMAGKGKGPVIGIDLGTTYSCVGMWQHEDHSLYGWNRS